MVSSKPKQVHGVVTPLLHLQKLNDMNRQLRTIEPRNPMLRLARMRSSKATVASAAMSDMLTGAASAPERYRSRCRVSCNCSSALAFATAAMPKRMARTTAITIDLRLAAVLTTVVSYHYLR